MTNPAIYIKGLVKEYVDGQSKFTAIDNLDLSILEGRVFGLLGPNGAGKSTVINILAGVITKTSGEVEISGVSIDRCPKEARRTIGVVPQEIALDSFFTLQEGLEFYAGYYGVPRKMRRTEEILRRLSLWDKRALRPIKLSGGMKRRFLIAKALVHSPKVLILDEPTAGVDLDLRNHLWQFIRELRDDGVTVILTTHYLAEAQELCDEIAFINKGRIIKCAPKEQLLCDLGQRYIDVTFKDPIDPALRDKLGCKVIDEKHLRFNLKETSSYKSILKDVAQIKGEIHDIETIQPDLEDIFYQIVHNDHEK